MLDNIAIQYAATIIQQAELDLTKIFGVAIQLRLNKPYLLTSKKDIGVDALLACRALQVSMESMIGTRRHRHLTASRQVLCFYLRGKQYTLKSIGKLINRDHTTIIHSCQTVKDLLDAKDPIILEKLDLLKNIATYETETNQSRDVEPLQPRKSSITVIPSPNLYRPPNQNNAYQVMGGATAANHHTPASLSP
jgi:hypothetical protein